MVKTSVSELPKRTTRSCSLTESARKQHEVQETVEPLFPSVFSNFLFREESISLDVLLQHFPGRRSQVLEILQLIGPLNSPMIPLFVYGGPSTGKSSVVTQVFRHLNRPFVYASCCSCYSPSILFQYVLNQLFLLTKNLRNDFSSSWSCERASDFIILLKDALTQFVSVVGECSDKSDLKQSTALGDGKMIYLVFDNVEMIRHWDGSSDLISILFKLQDLLRMVEVGLIYISRAGPNCYYANIGSTEPLPIFFPDYTEDDLYEILMRNQVNPKLYSSFLRVVLKPFYRVTRRLDELSIAFQPLFEKYREQVSDPKLLPDETMNRRLFDNIQPHIAPSIDEIMKVSSLQLQQDNTGKFSNEKRSAKKFHGNAAYDGLDFHMSLSTKYLFLSAFLASRNPPTLDSAMFDSTGGSSNQKRKRKSSEASRQEKDHNLQAMLLKGPGSFSLERLLAIFQCITYVADCYPERETLDNQMYEDERSGATSDVLLQLSSLCEANFISKSASCSLEGFTRYRCTVDEIIALKVARSISFPLSKYLYRG
ncbi:unnamed protein product [Spirodela intermedia]|uniref:Uncharacterized protein n=1 Tax=Spirodela intermedia TaxID=51605 RepID=A0A7I8JY64_SPIIN|nr:unnamed protein product [Spirodela intermedia]